MNSDLEKELETNLRDINEEDRKGLKVDVLQRLIKKLEKDEDSDIAQDLERLIQDLPGSPIDRMRRKACRKSLRAIQKKVKKAFGYVERGTLKDGYMGAWLAIGIALGAGIDSGAGEGSGSGVGIGIIAGLLIGISVGRAEEKKAERKGLVY